MQPTGRAEDHDSDAGSEGTEGQARTSGVVSDEHRAIVLRDAADAIDSTPDATALQIQAMLRLAASFCDTPKDVFDNG